jgi:hypothetical protein
MGELLDVVVVQVPGDEVEAEYEVESILDHALDEQV